MSGLDEIPGDCVFVTVCMDHGAGGKPRGYRLENLFALSVDDLVSFVAKAEVFANCADCGEWTGFNGATAREAHLHRRALRCDVCETRGSRQ